MALLLLILSLPDSSGDDLDCSVRDDLNSDSHGDSTAEEDQLPEGVMMSDVLGTHLALPIGRICIGSR